MNVLQPQSKPCGSCPYRRDVPAGVWHPEEYAKLREYDRDTGYQPPALFMCHTKRETLCAGWLGCHGPGKLLAVRLALLAGRVSPSILDFTTRTPLFLSAAHAAKHGLSGVQRPGASAKAVIAKLTRARRR